LRDLKAHFRAVFDGMFTKISWVEDLMDQLGVQGISQVWGDDPEYYLWLTDAPGVYHIKLESGDSDRSTQDRIRGLFSIRCYPLVGSRLMDGYSREEQRLVSSELFDHTNTPRYDCRDDIPPTFFTVGTMEIIQDIEHASTVWVVESLDRLLFKALHATDSTLVESTGGSAERGPATLRDVPGWSLSYSLFDRLVSMCAYCLGRQPCRVVLADSLGFEFHGGDGNGSGDAVPSDSIVSHTLAVAFVQPPADRGAVDSFIADLLAEQDHSVMLDTPFPHQACQDHGCENPAHKVVNPQWWSIPFGSYRSKLTTTCGCEDH